MRRGWAAATIAIALLAIAIVLGVLRHRSLRRSEGAAAEGTVRETSEVALARLQGIPFYRAVLAGRALRSASVGGDGALSVEVDLRAVVEPRLAALGFGGASAMFPAVARGTIVLERSAGTDPSASLRESWVFDGPSPLLELLDRSPTSRGATTALEAIPGAPVALVRARLLPSRLTDASWGGEALAVWRDRVSLAEKLLGRPVRAEIAEDLLGPAVFALYETADPTAAEAIVAAELRRSDRLAGLFDIVFGLGALAERATVRRYRGVATGSFESSSGGPGLALAVDGSVLFVATSRAFLESAIDARRDGPHRAGLAGDGGEASASWSAVSSSTFVAHGWARLARASYGRQPAGATTRAALWPEGTSSWRLEGRGAAPAITADPMLPFLRSAFARRQGLTD